MSTWEQVLVGVIPSIGVGLIFWFAMRAVLRSDRNERAALAKLDAEQDAAASADAESPAETAGETPAETRQD